MSINNGFIAKGIPKKPFRLAGTVYASSVGWMLKRKVQKANVIEKLHHCRDLDKMLEKAGFDVYGEPLKIVEDKVRLMTEENQRLMAEFDKEQEVIDELDDIESITESEKEELVIEPKTVDIIKEDVQIPEKEKMVITSDDIGSLEDILNIVEEPVEIKDPVICSKVNNYDCSGCEHGIPHEHGDCGKWRPCRKDGDDFKCRCQTV